LPPPTTPIGPSALATAPVVLSPLPMVDVPTKPAADRGMWLLHNQIVELANSLLPTEREAATLKRVTGALSGAAERCFGGATETVLFGSQTTGLALRDSDLDVVILGIVGNLKTPGQGFSLKFRRRCSSALGQLKGCLLNEKLINMAPKFIAKAKVPIIKCEMQDRVTKELLNVDISMGAANGAQAVQLVSRHVSSVWALRPLVLCVKAFLRQKGLNEPYRGGFSSYAVFNLVMAHLQMEGEAEGGGEGRDQDQQGGTSNLGQLLWRFFQRFGEEMDCESQAVSMLQGGIIRKPDSWHDPKRPWLMGIEDPQEPGINIGTSSFDVRMVRASMAAAAAALRQATDAAAVAAAAPEEAQAVAAVTGEFLVDRERQLWATVQADGSHRTAPRGVAADGKESGTSSSAGDGGEDPLGAIMNWRAEVTSGPEGSDLRRRAMEAGQRQVHQALLENGFPFSFERRPSLSGRSPSPGGEAVRGGGPGAGPGRGKSKGKTFKAKGKRGADESFEDKLARVQRPPAPSLRNTPPAGRKRGQAGAGPSPSSGGGGSWVAGSSSQLAKRRRQRGPD